MVCYRINVICCVATKIAIHCVVPRMLNPALKKSLYISYSPHTYHHHKKISVVFFIHDESYNVVSHVAIYGHPYWQVRKYP
jgi:hypothetical protein